MLNAKLSLTHPVSLVWGPGRPSLGRGCQEQSQVDGGPGLKMRRLTTSKLCLTTIINGLLALTVNIPSLRTKVGGLMTVGTLG